MLKTAEATQTAKQAYAAKLRQVLRRFDRLEETTVSDMIKALNVFRRDVISLLSGLPSDDEFNAFRLGALKDELDTMIPVLNTQLTQIANGAVMSGGRLGHETITEPLIAAGVTTFYNTPSLALINALQDWTADRITGITEETRKAISGEIRRVGLGGISPFQAMQNITRLMGFEARGPGKYIAKGIGYNAERIARTETNRALNLGAFTQSQEVARETPEAQKRWNATGDFRTRSAHLSAHGQLRPLDEPFNVGGELLAYPLDPAGSGKNTINCRCRMTIVHPDIGVVGGPLDGQIGAERKRRGAAAPKTAPPKTAVTPPPPKNLTTRQAISQLNKFERGIINQSYESAQVIDNFGNEIVTKDGGRDFVDFTNAEAAQFSGGFLTHNHPSGRSFSDADMLMTQRNELKAIRAVGANYQGVNMAYTFEVLDDAYYTMEETHDLWVMDFWEDALEAAKPEVDSWLTSGEFTNERIHEANYRVSHLQSEQFVKMVNEALGTEAIKYTRELFK